MQLRLMDMSDREFGTIHEAILRLLSEYGVLFEAGEARDILKKAGNRIDDQMRVHLDEKFVESVLRQIPPDGFTMYGRDEAKPLRVAVDSMCFRPSTGEPFVYEYETRERRPATMDDAKNLVLVTDALDGYDMVNSVVNPEDAPGTWGNIRRFINAHRYSMKPSDFTVSTAKEVSAVHRIASAIRGDERSLRERPLTAVDISMVTPLRCTAHESLAFLESARLGVPVEILTSPTMGVSAPVTLSGSVAVSMAEMIAAVCLLYQVCPGLGVINTARISPVDMRTTAYNYGAPELGIGSVVAAACCARYRIPTNLYGFGTVAKAVGAQSAMEKAFSGLLIALGHCHMITGSGILDNALVTSPELLVVDHEAIGVLKRIRKPIVIDEEAIGVDVLMRAMRESGTFMAEEHTLKYFREGELMDCGLNQWGSFDQWQRDGKPDLLDRAHKKVEEILKSHEVEPFEAGVDREIERVQSEFAAEK